MGEALLLVGGLFVITCVVPYVVALVLPGWKSLAVLLVVSLMLIAIALQWIYAEAHPDLYPLLHQQEADLGDEFIVPLTPALEALLAQAMPMVCGIVVCAAPLFRKDRWVTRKPLLLKIAGLFVTPVIIVAVSILH